jgi:diketogulonate reductase-like aldo/keto reductase
MIERGVFDKVPVHVTWEAMEKMHSEGLVKNLGTSNFSPLMLHDLLTYAKVRPVVNHIELRLIVIVVIFYVCHRPFQSAA